VRLFATDIARVVVKSDWQRTRLSMKGKSTEDKLSILEEWYSTGDPIDVGYESTCIDRQMQIQNYLNALSRGGLIEPFDMPNNSFKFKHLVVVKR
jgi:hypothetical protein